LAFEVGGQQERKHAEGFPVPRIKTLQTIWDIPWDIPDFANNAQTIQVLHKSNYQKTKDIYQNPLDRP
jgi:hypothetical protein